MRRSPEPAALRRQPSLCRYFDNSIGGSPTSTGQLMEREFDITSGAVLHGPATKPLATYEVREANEEIQIRA
jgi:hypothetical protein